MGEVIVSEAASVAALSPFDSQQYSLFPGFCDVHVHFREPGFSYKETIATGSAASARGGYTHVCTMPNLNPVPDSVEHLRQQLDIIEKDACIHVYPYGAITVGEKGEELADLEGMAPNVLGFSDDGRGVQNDDMMRQAIHAGENIIKMLLAIPETKSPWLFPDENGQRRTRVQATFNRIIDELGLQAPMTLRVLMKLFIG